VIDGDTLTVKAQIWLGQELTVSARIRGIDAPEIHGKCMREKSMAAAATNRLFAIAGGASVRLTNVEEDKYGGRVIADVTTEAGVEIAPAMLASGLVRPYDGTARGSWCDIAGLGG